MRLLKWVFGSGPRIVALIALVTAAYHLYSELRLARTRQANFHQRLELTAMDVKLAARGVRPPGAWRVAIAEADEASLESFGPLPWSREVHARLVRRLTELDAASIAFDMTFEGPSQGRLPEELVDGMREVLAEAQTTDVSTSTVWARLMALGDRWGPTPGGGDVDLAHAIRDSGKVVLGVVAFSQREADLRGTAATSDPWDALRPALLSELVEDRGHGMSMAHPARGAIRRGEYLKFFGVGLPTATVAASTRYFGALNAAPDSDGVNRSLPVVVGFMGQDVLLPTLAVAAVSAARGEPVELLGHPSFSMAEALSVGPGPPLALSPGAQVLLDWYGDLDASRIPRFSVSDILARRVPKSAIEGRVVFVAATAVGTYDQRVTPVERTVPGVYIHATLAQNLFDGRHLVRPPWMVPVELGFILLVGLILGGVMGRLRILPRVVVGLVLIVGWNLVDQWVLFERGLVVHTLLPTGQIFLTVLALSVFGFFVEERERRKTRTAFGRYLSPRVMEQVLADPETNLRLGGRRQSATVLFSDIRGFTSISESLDPEELGRMLNLYMTPMTRIVFAHEGTLDKYMGDALMAFWGAPVAQWDHPLRACQAALAMLEELDAVNARFEAMGLPKVSIGIGLSSGEMTIGNMGSEDFFAYTALGDRVNLGSRLEGQTKTYGVSVIISEGTFQQVRGVMLCRELDLLRVKGKREPERIYELIGPREHSSEKLLFVEVFESGLDAFRARRFDEARVYFEEARALGGDDRCSEQYADLSAFLSMHPPPESWDGVRDATHK